MIVRADSGGVFPLGDGTVQCVVTSPPYWGLRDYGVEGQLGLEGTLEEYVARLVGVFREVWRVLRDDGTVWLNLGDCYANYGKWGGETGGKQAYLDDANRKRVGREKRVTGLKPKDLVMMPARVALALQADGWWLRSDVIWNKPNCMPESVTDRPSRAHEYLFLLTKSGRDLYWVHRDRPYPEGNHSWPVPDYRWWDSVAGAELREVPAGSSLVTYIDADGKERSRYRRYNLWRGCDYYYDHEAVRVLAMESSVERQQRGSTPNPRRGQQTVGGPSSRDRGDGTIQMQPLGNGKQRGHGRRHEGFNGRWDHMSNEEQRAFGANLRDVWTISPEPSPEEHYAAYPEALVKPCILAGCPEGGVVLDPFVGTGTTVRVAQALNRKGVGLELDPKSCAIARRRTSQMTLC